MMESSTAAALQTASYDPDQSTETDELFDRMRHGALGGGESRVSSQPTGIKALMLAVLEDGIRCFLGRDKQARVEAEAWIHTQRKNWPFSFITVCHTLGLSPEAVRAAMWRMRERQMPARRIFARTRQNVRRRGKITLRRSVMERL